MADQSLHILLVEDDTQIRVRLGESLVHAGYSVEMRESLAGARAALSVPYDLILLDLGLPDGDGLDLCRSLRRSGDSTPIIMLTARDSVQQRIHGLDIGADDYVIKPFQLEELFARVRSVLRRSGQQEVGGRVTCGDLWIDADQRASGRGSSEFQLKPREFDLLLFLMRHPDRVWTRDQLLDRVWGVDAVGGSRTVDLHVRRLRTQIEIDASDPHCLKTVWGVGYRMSEPT